MSAPPPSKPQPKPAGKLVEHPVPEFMWCQRSDRVYVTIKVADCVDCSVNVTPEHVLEFRGRGHGMCGDREYELTAPLFGGVVAAECGWFVCGPSVRVRLQKEKAGPYWAALLVGKQKLPQLKVDWSSWLDEDEETERSAAPTGFDAAEMKMMMVGSDKDPLYRDLSATSSSASPDEGEENNSIIIDEGMNSIDDLQIKFKALEYEKEQTANTRKARHDLRRNTRAAQKFVAQRERDLRYGRPVRDVTAEELELVANADGLYEKLKTEKAEEKAFWLSKWWHQRRPEQKKIAMAEEDARTAGARAAEEELARIRGVGGDVAEPKTRRKLEHAVFSAARDAALAKFDQWEVTGSDQSKYQEVDGRRFTARDIGARLAREILARELGEPAKELPPSLKLKQWGDKKAAKKWNPKTKRYERPDGTPAERDEEADGEEDAEDLYASRSRLT